MKIGVSSYSFQQLIGSGKETQLSIMKIAKSMGFDAIEFTDLSCPDGMGEEEYAALIREESEKLGLPVIIYTIGANFLNEKGVDAEVERVCRKVDIAKILGASKLRHDAAWGIPQEIKKFTGFDQILPTLIDGCKRVTEYAKSLDIETMIENHGFLCQDSARNEKIITGVANENFGALIDIGNFSCADEENNRAVGVMAPYVKHVHAKDFYIRKDNGLNPGRGFFRSRGGNYLRGSIIGQGDVPVFQCLKILKESGYDGYVSVEFEGMENCLDGIAAGKENLERMFELL